MLYIIWSDRYDTGIPILDEQLRGLVSLINSFFFHRDDPDITQVLVPTAEMFKSYVMINFLTVEKLMAESGYPDLEEYRARHRKIFETVVRLDRRARAKQDPQMLLTVLKRYWFRSVKMISASYIDYLQKHYSPQGG